MNRNCACNIEIDKDNYLEDRTVGQSCYNKNRRQNEDIQALFGLLPRNNRTLIVGPSFSGKTHLMLTILSRTPDRDIYRITNSPFEQYSNSRIKIKETSCEIKPLSEYENVIIVFDDILDSSNSKFIGQFFLRGRHNNLDIYYLSQSYFD